MGEVVGKWITELRSGRSVL